MNSSNRKSQDRRKPGAASRGSGADVEAVGPGSRALAVLTRLADGASVSAGPDGIMLGTSEVTSAVAALIAHDLVRRTGDGFAVTAPGWNYLRRRNAARRWRKRAASGAADTGAVLANPYRDQHMDLANQMVTVAGEKPRRAWVNRDECPLGWLRRRRDRHGKAMISEIQFAAGERLRADFEMAGTLPRVTASWSGVAMDRRDRGRAPHTLDPTEAQMVARQRYDRAVATLPEGMRDVAMRVCCYREGLSDVERALDWPVRSAKIVLVLALDHLAKHYGIG